MCRMKKGEILFQMVVCRDVACRVSTGTHINYINYKRYMLQFE